MSEHRFGHSRRDQDLEARLPPQDREPQSVPAGRTRVARVVIAGFHGLPAEPLLVAWDDQREAVRLLDGRLQWYLDETRQAFPRGGDIVISDAGVYPRGNRYMDALAVRSLTDLIETVNAEDVTAIEAGGVVHVYGEHDHSVGTAVRQDVSGIIVRASGVEGTRPWTLEVVASGLVEGDQLLAPIDLTGPLPEPLIE